MIDRPFADGDYTFALSLPQLIELQRLRGAGIFTIYGRVLKGWYVTPEEIEFGVPHDGEAYAEDIFETVRLALIGGGQGIVNGDRVEIGPNRARQLVEAYCHPPQPLKESWALAKVILFAAVEGYDDPQKKSPQTNVGTSSRPKASTKRKSSPTAQ